MAHHSQEEKHPKQDFQIERIAFFSDAVFAIALTLLVLEFKPPSINNSTTSDGLLQQLADMKLKFAAFLFSFFLIINYWKRHHTLFKHIHNYNKQIINANMLILLPIIFFPFTSSFFYECLDSEIDIQIIPVRLFIINNILAGATTYFLYWTIMKRFPEMSYKMEKHESSEFEEKLLITTIAFLLMLLLSFIAFEYCFWGVLLIPFYYLYKKFFLKNHTTNKNAKQNTGTANT